MEGVLAAVVILSSRLDGFWGKTLSSACQHAGSAFVAAAAGRTVQSAQYDQNTKRHSTVHITYGKL